MVNHRNVKLINYSIFLLIVALSFFSTGHAYIAKDLPNLYKINDHLYRGGQPTEAGVQQLKQFGVKTIIDLRDHDDLSKREEAWAKAAGIRFINYPESGWFKPDRSRVDAIIREIDSPENQPVFIHCKRGADRTGTMIAVYRISHEGWTADKAIAEAKQFAMGWWQFWMKDYIKDYYREHTNNLQGK